MMIKNIKFFIRSFLISISDLVFTKKPKDLKIKDFLYLVFMSTRYQSLKFKDGSILKKKCSDNIIDNFEKIKLLNIDNFYKSYLDIGCSEGTFLIEAFLNNCKDITGIDIQDNRLKVAQILIKNWKCSDYIKLIKTDVRKFKTNKKFDIVTCLSVGHHFHGNRNHDTWNILNNKEKFSEEYNNIIAFFKKISELTEKYAYIEYCYEFDNKITNFNENLLSKEISKLKIFREFVYLKYTQKSTNKLRILYLGTN